VLEVVQSPVSALPKRFGVRGITVGDLLVSRNGVWAISPAGLVLVHLTDVEAQAFLAKARNVPTFSVLPEEVTRATTEAA